MNRKKSFTVFYLLLVCILSLCFVFVSCSKSSDKKDNEANGDKKEYAMGEYTLLDFEKESDKFAVRPYIDDILDAYGSVSVSFEKEYAASGSGSLLYSYGAGKKPSIAFYPERTAYSDLPMEKLASFGISVYSTATEEQQVTLSLVSGKEPVYEEKHALVPGRNDFVIEVDPLLVRFRADEVKALCVEFAPDAPCDYYLDDFKATIGERELTEVQKTAELFVKAVNATEGNVTGQSGDALLQAYGYYTQLDAACKAAVKVFYEKFENCVTKFFEIIGWDEDPEKTTLLYLSENYGVLQFDEEVGVNYAFSSDAFDKDGGTKLSFDSTKNEYTLSFDIPTVVIDDYDYLSLKADNVSACDITIRFNEAQGATIAAGERKEIELSMDGITEKNNTVTFVIGKEVSSQGGDGSLTELYLSSVFANTLPRETVYESVLNRKSPYLTEGNADLKNLKNKTVITVNDITCEIIPQKVVTDINVGQVVTFASSAETQTVLSLYDKRDNIFKEVIVSSSVSIFRLTKAEYENLQYIKADKMGKISVSDMLLSRSDDTDYTEILFRNDYIVKKDAMTVDSLREAIYFLNSFENMLYYKQNYMRVNDPDVYNDILGRAEAVSDIYEQIVARLGEGVADNTDCGIVLDMSGVYETLKTVRPLDVSAEKIVRNAKKNELLKYKYTLFDFADIAAASKFTCDGKWTDWSGTISAEEFDGGKKLAINIQKVSDAYANDRRAYVTYDYSGSSLSLSNYDYVVWRIYNAGANESRLFFVLYGWEGTVSSCALPSGEWTEIKLSVSDFKRAKQLVIYPCDSGDKFYIDNVYAYSVPYVQSRIDKLPDVSNITGKDRALVNEVRREYENLSSLSKGKVNIEKLVLCENTLSRLPFTVFDMSEENITDSFSHPTNVGAYLWDGYFDVREDANYGKVLAVSTSGTTGTQPVLYFGYKLGSKNLSDYDYVKFSVYNPKNVDLTFAVITMGWGKDYYVGKIKANSWTEIVVSASDFASAGYFYIANVEKNEELTFLFTDIVAYKNESSGLGENELPPVDITDFDFAERLSENKRYTAKENDFVD